MKEIIKLFVPPVFLLFYKRLKRRDNNVLFSGVYNNINEIHDEKPWVQRRWIELSKTKLKKITKVSDDRFLPTTDFEGYPVLLCLIINMLSQDSPCHVLDFAGGTGYIYFKIRPYLNMPDNVTYHVVDNNPELLKIGKAHAKSTGNDNKIIFHSEVPQKSGYKFDVLYINTSLQYIYDYQSLLPQLLQYKPKYVIFTRLCAGDMKTYITSERAYGYNTPCIIINFKEILEMLSENGFDLIFKSPCAEEIFEGKYDNNIPRSLHILNTANLIFRQKN